MTTGNEEKSDGDKVDGDTVHLFISITLIWIIESSK